MTTSLSRIGIILVGFTLLCSAPAAAKDNEAVKQAKQHFKRGETAYSLGRFEEALAEYSAAYEAKPLPAFLFNVAQCHMELKSYERAVFFYEGYLSAVPESASRSLAEGRLTEARAALAAQQKAAERQAEEEKQQQRERVQKAEEDQRHVESERLAAEKLATSALTAPSIQVAAAVEPEPLYKRWWFWTIVGVVVTAGGGTAVYLATRPTIRTVLPAGDLGTIDARP